MKTTQPQLGQKILELRKANGLTQEELVERCNINVRTIQRIEAGEVTPRPHTIRVILEALNYEFRQNDSEASPSLDPRIAAWFLRGLIAGGIYLILAFVEAYLEFQLISDGSATISPLLYTLIKVGVAVSFLGYMGGFFAMGNAFRNSWIKLGSILLAAGTVLCLSSDLLMFFNDYISREGILVSQSILAGVLYPVFGVGLIAYQKRFGNLALVTGILTILTGLAFLSVVLALPGLVLLTVVEVLGLVLLYRAYEYGVSKPVGSTVAD
ncbi:helix-turn-helix domain-containing protein [Lunatibacter salilacus]|uniref:helix-turn-helix domain-containing protein n=1 Tax=Lunatibacter salilacus TaxID=2483804 RepID=UPI00131B0877|nr:helix-turn-helix transcriptional regulator [Lunatibacter salilacus]